MNKTSYTLIDNFILDYEQVKIFIIFDTVTFLIIAILQLLFRMRFLAEFSVYLFAKTVARVYCFSENSWTIQF